MDFQKLKICYFDSTEIVKNDIVWGLMELGVQVSAPYGKIPLNIYSENTVEELKGVLVPFDAAMSQNFSRVLAKACHEVGKTYISWVYDAPQATLFYEEAQYDTNFIFMFDRVQIQRLQATGLRNVFFSPLAANILRTNQLQLTEADAERFSCDISFVGQLYQKKYFKDFLNSLSEEGQKELKEYLDQNVMHYGNKQVFDTAGPALRGILSRFVEGSNETTISKSYLEDTLLLVPMIARAERRRILEYCSTKYHTVMYTGDTELASGIEGLDVRGYIDNEVGLYKVNAFSKICLNTTLRSIESGVSQRVFDILAIGGFVLSDPQPELYELFEVGNEVEVYHSMEELSAKADFYLHHEKERLTVALAGYKKVAECYTYPILLEKILSQVFS